MNDGATVECCPICAAAHHYELLVTRAKAHGEGGTVMRSRIFTCPATNRVFEHRFALQYKPGEQIVEVQVRPARNTSAQPPTQTVSRVFVSYSRSDELLVTPIVAIMRAVGSSVFRDADSIPYGKRWRPVIEQSIHNASVVIVFWCEHARASEEVANEWRLAIAERIDIVPTLLDDTPLAAELGQYQGVDLRALTIGHGRKERTTRWLRARAVDSDSTGVAANRLLAVLRGGRGLITI